MRSLSEHPRKRPNECLSARPYFLSRFLFVRKMAMSRRMAITFSLMCVNLWTMPLSDLCRVSFFTEPSMRTRSCVKIDEGSILKDMSVRERYSCMRKG